MSCEHPIGEDALAIRSRFSPQEPRCLRHSVGVVAGHRVCAQHLRYVMQQDTTPIFCNGVEAYTYRWGSGHICGRCGKPVQVVLPDKEATNGNRR